MKLKKYLLAIVFFPLSICLNGQDIVPYQLLTDSINPLSRFNEPYQPFKFEVTMGTSIGRFGPGNFATSFIAPKVNYKLNSKWKVSGGLFFLNNLSSSSFNGKKDTFFPYPGTPRNLYIFGESVYQVSEKLSLHGSVFKSLTPAGNNLKANPMMNFSNNFASMGFNFQLNESISFGAQFSFSEGYHPYNNSFYSPGFGTFNQYQNKIPFYF